MKHLATDTLQRWRLILGGEDNGGLCSDMIRVDACLSALYDQPAERSAGLGPSCPGVATWLGDIRQYFPVSVVQLLQQDALSRLNLEQMLLEPELLSQVEADVHLVANLLALRRLLPDSTREIARQVVRKVVDDLHRRLLQPLHQAVRGSLNRAERNHRPRHAEIDWPRTLKRNLHHWQPDRKTLIVERLVGHGRRQSALRDILVCVDQSGSMAPSVVYAGVFAAALASLRSVNTRMVVFDTAVVDLSEDLQDPVDLLFGIQLGGGTDIDKALAYCQTQIERPEQSILVLITDLYEGGNPRSMLARAAQIKASGVNLICLLALSDEGAPGYDRQHAAQFAQLGIPTFACTPDRFPALMAAAIQKQDLGLWAARAGIVTSRGAETP